MTNNDPKSRTVSIQCPVYMASICTNVCARAELEGEMLLPIAHSNIIFCYILCTHRFFAVCIGFYCFVYWVKRNKHCMYWIDYAILKAYCNVLYTTICHITPPSPQHSFSLCQRLWFHFAQLSHKTVNTCTDTYTYMCAYTNIPHTICPCAEHFPAFYLLCRNSETAWK